MGLFPLVVLTNRKNKDDNNGTYVSNHCDYKNFSYSLLKCQALC